MKLKQHLENTKLTGVPYGTYDVDLTVAASAQELEFSKLQLDSYQEVIVVDSPLTPIDADFSPASSHLEVIVNASDRFTWTLSHQTGYYEPQVDAVVEITITDTTDGGLYEGGIKLDLERAKTHTVEFHINIDSKVYISSTIDGYDPGTYDVILSGYTPVAGTELVTSLYGTPTEIGNFLYWYSVVEHVDWDFGSGPEDARIAIVYSGTANSWRLMYQPNVGTGQNFVSYDSLEAILEYINNL